VKSGYPPRPLTVVPELPVSSLGLQRGDQIIVSEAPADVTPGSSSISPQSPSRSAAAPSRSAPTRTSVPAPAPAPTLKPTESGPDAVEVDGSFLVHRVRIGASFMITRLICTLVILQVVPDDNSCLFSSIALIFERSISKASQIRQRTFLCFPYLCLTNPSISQS